MTKQFYCILLGQWGNCGDWLGAAIGDAGEPVGQHVSSSPGWSAYDLKQQVNRYTAENNITDFAVSFYTLEEAPEHVKELLAKANEAATAPPSVCVGEWS